MLSVGSPNGLGNDQHDRHRHWLVDANDLSKLDAAFFTMNGIISITFFGFVLAERLVR